MAKKKDFTAAFNPATQFISMPANEQQETPQATTEPAQVETTTAPPAGYKADPRYIETKSRRVQMLIQPSLHDRIKARAKQERRSVNDMMHLLLEEALAAGGKE